MAFDAALAHRLELANWQNQCAYRCKFVDAIRALKVGSYKLEDYSGSEYMPLLGAAFAMCATPPEPDLLVGEEVRGSVWLKDSHSKSVLDDQLEELPTSPYQQRNRATRFALSVAGEFEV